MKKHTHEKHGLTFQELGAFMGTRALLEAHMIKFRTTISGTASLVCPLKEGEHLFNMNIALVNDDVPCGSVGCIGGTMAQIMGLSTVRAENRSYDDVTRFVNYQQEKFKRPELHHLFHPPVVFDWNRITPKYAIAAMDNYLKYGRARWFRVLPSSVLKPRYRRGGCLYWQTQDLRNAEDLSDKIAQFGRRGFKRSTG